MESSTHLLWRLRRNEIYRAIEEARLDPNQFSFEDDGSVVWVKHSLSESYFTITGGPTEFNLRYRAMDLPEQQRDGCSWLRVTQTAFPLWLSDVRLDIDTTDLWAKLRGENELLRFAADVSSDNSPFTTGEREEIAVRLREITEYVRETHKLTVEQTRLLKENFDYLIVASNRLGRKDWLMLFLGGIFGFALSTASSSDSVRDILLLCLRAIGHVFGFPELPSG